jgi:hypothetical protein
MGEAAMEYALAAMVGAGAVAASLAWGWIAAGRRFEPVEICRGEAPRLVRVQGQAVSEPGRAVHAAPETAAAAAARRLELIVAENRERQGAQNAIRSPRQS